MLVEHGRVNPDRRSHKDGPGAASPGVHVLVDGRVHQHEEEGSVGYHRPGDVVRGIETRSGWM
eukprot:365077-Chlamydomonas_euryale.AAC.6